MHIINEDEAKIPPSRAAMQVSRDPFSDRHLQEDSAIISRDIVVALIRSGVRLVSVQNTDPEAVGGMYGRLFNAIRHTIERSEDR